MKAYIKERTLQVANYISGTQKTIRQTAKVFHLSKSTVHNDLAKRLAQVDPALYEDVKKILDKNFEEKHIRGGQATKSKYQELERNRWRDSFKGNYKEKYRIKNYKKNKEKMRKLKQKTN